MKSYYEDMAELIEHNFRHKVRMSTISVGELRTFEPDTFLKKIKKYFAKQKSKKEFIDSALDTKSEQLPTSFINTLTSFSGADLVVSIGNKVVGELTNIRWFKPHESFLEQLPNSDYYDKELAIKKPVAVLAEWAIFDKEALGSLKDADIILTYANEYGQSAYRAIHGVTSLFEISGTSVDEIVSEGYMILAAERVTELKPGVTCEE